MRIRNQKVDESLTYVGVGVCLGISQLVTEFRFGEKRHQGIGKIIDIEKNMALCKSADLTL